MEGTRYRGDKGHLIKGLVNFLINFEITTFKVIKIRSYDF